MSNIDAYAPENLGAFQLGRTAYGIEQRGNALYLIGPRGGEYVLAPVYERGGHAGMYQPFNAEGGAPMRYRGNLVRVYYLGGSMELANR